MNKLGISLIRDCRYNMGVASHRQAEPNYSKI